MEQKQLEIEKLLYEFAIILEKETDLRHLYFITLPVIMIAFNLEKSIIFKYSRRKQCFDPKAGLAKKDIEPIAKAWNNSKKEGDFAEYLLNLDINELYGTAFNTKITMINIPCNDISRSIISPFLFKYDKNIVIDKIENRHIKRTLTNMDMEKFLYSPLISKDSTVGFMLNSPDNIEKRLLKPFLSGLSNTMNVFITDKELSSLKHFVESNKEDIEHKQRLYEIGKTASTITHEIKNSLIGIIGLFNKLKKYIDVDNSDKAKTYTEVIDNELGRMYRFAVDINKYSSNYTVLNKEILDLKEIIDRAIDMTNSINNNFVFSVCIDEKAANVFADKQKLEQVLINLFKNSIEAYDKKEGGRINIKAKRKGGFIVLKIKDNSGGVNEQDLKEIIKPFYTTKSHGTGLGLSIVKEIIKEHGGNIEFKNTQDGLECTIKLAIPKNIITEVKNG